MGLFNAMTASVAGLASQGEAISVISDNLSNANTVGYKNSRAIFSQLVTSSSGASYNAGGVNSAVTRSQNAQGSFQSSDEVTHMALSGNGFFMVTDSSTISSNTSTFFTRAGAFTEDKEGFLSTPSGHFLQGWQTDSDGNVLSIQQPTSIELASVGVSAAATTELRVGANLTATETTNGVYDTTGTLATALGNVVSTPANADYLSDVRMYDAQGSARDITLGFTKRSANMWDWVAYTDGGNLEGGTSGTNAQIGSGTLRFDTDGNLKYATGTTITADWGGGVDDGTITLDFGEYKGGKIASANTNLGFTDHVLDIAVEDNTFNIGTYDVVFTAAGTVELQQGGVTVAGSATTTPTSSTQREIVFGTTGVRMTVSPNFNAAPGSYPNTIGNFTVTDQTPLLGGEGTDGVVQFAAAYNTNFLRQDGFGSGSLSAIQIDEEGLISGTFTNGETKALWKVAIGVFQNPAGLETVSNSLLRTTDESGQVLLKEAGVGGTATVVSGALEGSTVDIANEFSTMIVSQRAYQANSTVISTVDQMLNELMQLR